MAARMNKALWMLALATMFANVQAAENLPDPTQPPARLLASQVAGVAAGPVLQSVMLPRPGRASAVIDGQQVRLGERYADARLIRVTETEAVLEGASGRQVLRLTPAVTKDPSHKKKRSSR